MGYLFIIIALLFNVAGNLMLKVAAPKAISFFSLPLLEAIKVNSNLIIGITFFALNVIFYVIALSKLNLSTAYPIMAGGGLTIVTLFSIFALKEHVSHLQIVGIFFVFFGILLITLKGNASL